MSRDDFEIIYLTYYNVLRIFACRIVSDDSAAEDIIQDVFADLWANRKNIDLSESVKPYLYKVTHNRSLDFLKLSENKNIPISYQTDLLEDMLYTTFTAHEELSFDDVEKEILDCVKQLPERCKEVFLLSRHDNLKNREIAEKLEISIKTVEKHISLALSSLNKHLQNRGYRL
ncbi:MAG: RNA polymerase sigma-70 factor [Fermentimonas sp.]|nr:RNA polymerase sigma-70 factor [Fermentimonas sp.]